MGLKCILQVEVPFTQSTSEGQQVLRDGSRQKPVLSSYNTYVCGGGSHQGVVGGSHGMEELV